MQIEETIQPRACVRHPGVETYLSCSRCGDAVCPRCMVHAAVGIRCPSCARAQKVPTYDVGAKHLGVALLVGVAATAVAAIAWNFALGYGMLGWLLMVGLGMGIGQVMSRAVNGKRGRLLQVIAGGSLVAGFGIMLMMNPELLNPEFLFRYLLFALFALLLAVVAAASPLR